MRKLSATRAQGTLRFLFSNRSNGKRAPSRKTASSSGMFPEADYSSIEMPLQPGDRYVLYTDGLPESNNPRAEEFGLPRCMQFLDSHSRLSAAALADQAAQRNRPMDRGGALQAVLRRMT